MPQEPNLLRQQAQTQLHHQGWCSFHDPTALLPWVESVYPSAIALLDQEAHRQGWRHGCTWFVGVNALVNNEHGAVEGGLALPNSLCTWVKQEAGLADGEALHWEPAQVSVLRPGYPKQDADESDAAHGFRMRRDAAHVDGLLPVGPARRRMPQEFHRFILGIPLQNVAAHAGPTVVWRGSHLIMQRAIAAVLRDIPEPLWPQTDLTEVYQQTRREVFERCQRVELHVPRGSCYLIHRFALHGVAPWVAREGDNKALRPVVFFRPEIGDRQDWLTAD